MKILAVGGGSGGHVTPVIAVFKEIRSELPDAELRFWCDRKFADQARMAMSSFDKSLRVDTIAAGKLRRYHHLTVWQHLTWPSLMLRNIRDSFLVVVGAVQSFFKLLFWRPDVVFTKGGYVCLPVGLVVHFLRIPLVIHDSDAHPGLTNRVLSRWADVIATGAPLKYYNYPKAKSHYVGIPIDTKFHKFTKEEAEQAKEQWGLSPEFPVLVVTGGGLGATRINDAIVEVLSKLQQYVSVVLVSGVGQYDDLRSRLPANDDRFQLHAFITTMPSLLAAADVVVARAGATTLLELAATEKATILVPNGKLAGGHQLKNAKVYEDADAVLVLDEAEMEDNPKRLVDMVKEVIDSPEKTEAMTKKFGTFAKPRAAHDMMKLIISTGSKGEA